MKTRKGYKVYPLTSAQKLHFYCLKYCPKKQVLNIGSSLTIQVDLDWDVLKSCIQEAIARCDTMRLRFTHDKEGKDVYKRQVLYPLAMSTTRTPLVKPPMLREGTPLSTYVSFWNSISPR